MVSDKLLTTEQVAALLQVHPFTVLKYIKSGKIKAIKLGRVWRIRERDVEGFLEERSMASKEPKDTPTISKKTSTDINEIEIEEKILPNDKSDHYILE